MAWTECPQCHQPVSEQARACPACGYPLKGAAGVPSGRFGSGAEYKSKAALFGWPLIHICTAVDPEGRLKPARGIIAIGNVAIGVVAVGGVAFGWVCVGGMSVGLFAIGGLAVGIGVALGGLAVGYVALGGAAIGIYAIGGLSIGVHTLHNDPGLLEFLRNMGRNPRRLWP